MIRQASVTRNTKETQISLKLNLDGTGHSDLDTGVGFFDHMLDGFTRHGLFDLDAKSKGRSAGQMTIILSRIPESSLEPP